MKIILSPNPYRDKQFQTALQAKKILEELICQLGLAETLSYYKITCPKKVSIECGTLTGEQRAWWRKLYYNGLGEFMYRNGIEVSEEELLTIECPSPKEQGVRKPLWQRYVRERYGLRRYKKGCGGIGRVS